ncbi:hypothetical protein ABZ434_22465 [Streptomyces sp. NPDC005761]|uniref:hypothetical protein n=1 Tax=unclassified Streptomyces TaxID=2593676 RepID=UPI0033CA8D31
MQQGGTSCHVPEWLSRVDRKREIYAGDPYYRDAWDDVSAVLGTGPAVADALHAVAPLVLRPDAVAARGGAGLLTAVRDAGFVPVAWSTFRFDRHTTREVWRYQLNIATRERIDVMDLIMPAGESLYVLLRDTRKTGIPATTRLSGLKGPSRPEDRETHHLRRIAGAAQASVLTYVHVSDEPADIVRELGIFFDRPERTRLLGALDARQDVTDQVLAVLAEIEQRTEACDLSWKSALERLSRLLADRPDGTELNSMLERVRSGRSRDWRSLLDQADRLGLKWRHWDRVAVAAELSARHLEVEPVIPDVGRSAWTADEPACPEDRGAAALPA